MRSHFVLKERDFLFDDPSHDLDLVCVERPKFNRALNELVNLTSLESFLAHVQELETIPETLRTVAEIEQAFQVANQANLSREELADLDHQEMFIQDQRSAVRKALKQGMKQGVQQTQRAIAQRLLSLLSQASRGGGRCNKHNERRPTVTPDEG